MSELVWDATGTRKYETGTDHGVLYLQDAQGAYSSGVAWNGLTAVTQSPSGAEPNDFWADNIKYATIRSAETLGLTIEAYTYPDEFEQCDGQASLATGVVIGQQSRKTFGFCYRTLVGNDTQNASASDGPYKLHLIYGCTASPSERAYQTVNDSPDAITFSWEVNTTPVNVAGYRPTASLEIDSATADSEKLATLKGWLYGTENTEPRLPLPDEVAGLFNGDGDDDEEDGE